MPAKVVSQALKHVWSTLRATKAPMAVMGGLALARWQHVRATQDVDLLIDLGASDLTSVLASLQAAGVHPKRHPPIVKLGAMSILQLNYEAPESFIPIQVDLLMAEGEYHRMALARRIPTWLPELDLEVEVLTCEDLLLHKLLAARLIDRADCVALLKANRGVLGLEYLRSWAQKLNLMTPLTEVWSEAFPGEPSWR